MPETTVYEAACPVCGAVTQVISAFWSPSFYCCRRGEPARAYPASACRGKHTLAEIRVALGLPVRRGEDPNRVVG